MSEVNPLRMTLAEIRVSLEMARTHVAESQVELQHLRNAIAGGEDPSVSMHFRNQVVARLQAAQGAVAGAEALVAHIIDVLERPRPQGDRKLERVK